MRRFVIILLALFNVTTAGCRSVAPSPAPTGTAVISVDQPERARPAAHERTTSCMPPETVSAASGSLAIEVVPISPWCDGTARWRFVFTNSSNLPISVPVEAADPARYTGSAFLELSKEPSFGLAMLQNSPPPPAVELAAHDTLSVVQKFPNAAGRAGPWNVALKLSWDAHEVSVSLDYLLRLSEKTECLRVCRGVR